jgi:hypothetical protein
MLLLRREQAGAFYTILGHNYMLLPPPSSFWAAIVTGRKIQLTRLLGVRHCNLCRRRRTHPAKPPDLRNPVDERLPFILAALKKCRLRKD